MNRVSERPTISDTKRSFHRCFNRVIIPTYRQVVDELLVELNLLVYQRSFLQDSIFFTGLCQTFDSFMGEYRPEAQKNEIFSAICSAVDLDSSTIRREVAHARETMAGQSWDDVQRWYNNSEAAPDVIRRFLERVQQPDFHYNRLQAVGLMALIEAAIGIDPDDAAAASKAAKQLAGEAGLAQERFNKDVDLYRRNLEKMAQSLAAMEESVAAERRRRKRQEEEKANAEASPQPEDSPSSAAAPSEDADTADDNAQATTPAEP